MLSESACNKPQEAVQAREWRGVRFLTIQVPSGAPRATSSNRPRNRKARGALLWALAGFIFFQIALTAAIELCWPQLRDPDYFYKEERLKQRLADCDPGTPPRLVLMLGSSRTAFGLKGTDVEQWLSLRSGRPTAVFNFGLFGAGPAGQLLCYQRLRDAGIRPDLLLIELFPVFLDERFGPAAERARLTADKLRLSELELLEECGFHIDGMHSAWWQAVRTPWLSHRFAVLNAVAPDFLPPMLRSDWGRTPDPTGWVAPQAVRPEPSAVAGTRRLYGRCLQHFRPGGPCCQAVHELLDRCRQDNIPCALVLMPEGAAFQSLYSRRALRRINAFLTELRREYGVPIVNARAWVADKDFADAQHLLVYGAETFSARLARAVLQRKLLPAPGP